MLFSKWRKQNSTLQLREDEFSWQGAHTDDKRVFLRRLKSDPSDFTDVLLGSLEDEEAVSVFSEFIKQTLGINSKQIRLSSIGGVQDDKERTVETFDHLVGIAQTSLLKIGITSPNAYLDQRGRKWDAVIEVNYQE